MNVEYKWTQTAVKSKERQEAPSMAGGRAPVVFLRTWTGLEPTRRALHVKDRGWLKSNSASRTS